MENNEKNGQWVKEIESYLVSKGLNNDCAFAISVWLEKKVVELSNERYKELVLNFAEGLEEMGKNMRGALNG